MVFLTSINIKDFIKRVLDNSIEYDDEFSNILDEISSNKDLQAQFISTFNGAEKKLNKSNVNYALSLVMELAINHGADLKTMYPLFLRMMFQEYSLDYSLCYRFCKLLIHMKDGDKEFVFTEILNKMSPENLVTSRISVCALYGNFSFDDFRSGLVTRYLDKVYKCLIVNQNDDYFKRDIKNFLINRLKDSNYDTYITKFERYLS